MLRRLASCAALVLLGLVNSPAVGAAADPLLPVPTAADLSTSNPSSSCVILPDDAPFVNLNTIIGPVMNIRTTVAVTEVVTATVEFWQLEGAAPMVTSTVSPVVSSTGPGILRVGFRFAPALADGEYFWRARVTDADSGPEVPWSPSCYLNQDGTRPAPPVISSTDFPTGEVGLGVGRLGTFRLAASDADVIGFEYTFGSDILVGGPILPVGPDGAATIAYVPTSPGPARLIARTVDRAGNRSLQQTAYDFFVGQASGPVAVWHFDDGSGTVAAGDPGPAGTLVGGAAFSTRGKVGGAVRLDGTSGYVSTPLTLDTGTTFAVSAWVRLTGTQQDQPVLAEGDASGDSFSLGYRADLGHWAFSAATATATADATVSAASPQRGVWTHLAGVYDGDALRLYVDGHADGVVAHPAPAAAAGTVLVGRDPAADLFLAGQVDQVRVFDRAVFPDQLHDLVNADDTAEPVGVWHFDETGGHLAADSAGNQPILLAGGASFTADGQFAGGLRLAGTTAQASTVMPVLRTDRSFTIGVWVERTAPGPATALSAGTSTGTVISLWFEPIFEGFGEWHFLLRGADGSLEAVASTFAADTTGTWTHLAVTWDEFTGQVSLQIREPDGSGLATTVQTIPARATTGLLLGADPANPDQGRLTGVLDELRIYQGAMSQTQLNNLPTVH